MLNVDISNCMVCEDLLMALNTVKKAGFISCAVYEKTNKEENAKKQLSDFYIEDFNVLIKLIK